ncbi:uncharacterized protein LOC135694466 [Rhopilema esculentum]|uniref:uncharacterized protein LOC135694466 n=1 Tax=Rhopilema esculentum TaxID=499914 RepID=UPI0031E3D66A
MTGGNSTAMERVALNQSLQKLKNDIPIRELTTDASSTIIKDMRKNHQEINHTLDIWHKSKNLRKALLKVGKKRSLHKIRLWAHEIVNHFWFICQSCNPGGDLTDMEALEKLKSDWLGVLHHVCNEHEWVGGACKHQIIDDHELPWFKETDGDYKALQQIVLDPKFLNSLQYYTRFRHTGKLECINNLSLAYASKRIAFGFDAFKARKCLAAIDWNSHLNRSPAVNKKTGKFLVTRKYNPRTNNWTIKKLFNEKDYPYVPMMIAKILRKRISEYGELNKKIVLKESDPRKIAATIGKSPPEPTAEIAKRYVSRLDFAKK